MLELIPRPTSSGDTAGAFVRIYQDQNVFREYIKSKGEMEEADIRPGTIPQDGNYV